MCAHMHSTITMELQPTFCPSRYSSGYMWIHFFANDGSGSTSDVVEISTVKQIYIYIYTLCYAIVLLGRKSDFQAGFWPDCYRENSDIGSPAGLRPAERPISVLPR